MGDKHLLISFNTDNDFHLSHIALFLYPILSLENNYSDNKCLPCINTFCTIKVPFTLGNEGRVATT